MNLISYLQILNILYTYLYRTFQQAYPQVYFTLLKSVLAHVIHDLTDYHGFVTQQFV
jgi:hypothetical protein